MKIRTPLMMIAAAVLLLFVAQACGGGGSGAEPTVTAIPLPSGEDGIGPGGPGQGFGGGGPFGGLAEPDEELAAFFGFSLAELEDDLSADGATLGQIADATGRSREELLAFLLDRAEAAFAEGDGPGNFPGGNADFLTEQLPTIIENLINGEGEGFGGGNFPGGFPRGTPGAPGGFGGFLGLGGGNEQLADFLGLSADDLTERLAEDETTPADIAEDSGRTREELFNFLLAQAEANIVQAVSDGTLTQENADQFLDGLTETIDGFINGTGIGGFGRGPFGGNATPEASE